MTTMTFCSGCGEKLPEDAYFCPKCGVRTTKGAEAGVHSPAEDLREAFSKMGQEMEKAFTIAVEEMRKAFKTARDNVRQSNRGQSIVCTSCGEKNPGHASFCTKCGKELE